MGPRASLGGFPDHPHSCYGEHSSSASRNSLVTLMWHHEPSKLGLPRQTELSVKAVTLGKSLRLAELPQLPHP